MEQSVALGLYIGKLLVQSPSRGRRYAEAGRPLSWSDQPATAACGEDWSWSCRSCWLWAWIPPLVDGSSKHSVEQLRATRKQEISLIDVFGGWGERVADLICHDDHDQNDQLVILHRFGLQVIGVFVMTFEVILDHRMRTWLTLLLNEIKL
jgi:hypothetical protein